MLQNNNLVIIAGFIPFPPDVKQTANSKLCQFKVHTKKKIKKQDGTSADINTYVECKCWGKSAENFSKYVHQGDYIELSGSLSVESWEEKETLKKRSKMVVEMDSYRNISLILGVGSAVPSSQDNQSFSAGGGQQNGGSGFGGQPQGGFGSVPAAPPVGADGLPPSFGQPPQSMAQQKSSVDDSLDGIM